MVPYDEAGTGRGLMVPYDEAGTGRAIMLLHAGVADRTMWSEHLDPVAAAGYRVVAIDLPGFGEAPVGDGPDAPWTHVLAAMDALGIDHATLVGNSFGAAVALRVAVIAPSRVSALVLISAQAPGVEPSMQLQAAWAAEESALERRDIEGAVAAVVQAWTVPGAPATVRKRVSAMQRRAFELQANAASDAEAPDPVDEDPGVLRKLEIPALVMSGEMDMYDFQRGAEVLAGMLPRARHHLIEGAGHLAPLETPEEFRRLLFEFLSK